MGSKEKTALIFCGIICQRLKKFTRKQFASIDIYDIPAISSLLTFDIYALNEEWQSAEDLPKQIILFGLAETVALQTHFFKPFDWVIKLKKSGSKIDFIPCTDKWNETLKKISGEEDNNPILWSTVDLQDCEPSPAEKLLLALDCQGRMAHEKSFLNYVYLNQPLRPVHFKLADKLELNLHFRTLDELAFVILPDSDKSNFLPALLLLRHWRQSENYADQDYASTPVFAFFYSGESFPVLEHGGDFEQLALTEFQFYADINAFHQVLSCFWLLHERISNKNDRDSHFSLRFSLKRKSDKFHQAISQACFSLMGRNRLVSRYHCTFYLPLYTGNEVFRSQSDAVEQVKYPPDTSKQKNPRTIAEAQAYWYFHPPIRDYLFDTDADTQLESIHEWRLNNLVEQHKSVYQWCLKHPETGKQIKADVTEVRLYQYFNHLCMLAISVKPAGEISESSVFHEESDRWWHCLAFSGLDEWLLIKTRQVNDWLAFTRLARILYPSYAQQQDEAKIAQNYLWANGHVLEDTLTDIECLDLSIKPLGNENFSRLVTYFLSQFFEPKKLNDWLASDFHQVFDDRMFVNVAYGLNSPQLDSKSADRLFKLALFVDAQSGTYPAFDGYAYDPEFLQQTAESLCYNRWQAIGTLSGYCNYSNAYLGSGVFFSDVIVKDHVPLIYGRMLMITLFYQASLRFYNRQVMHITEDMQECTCYIYYMCYRKIQNKVSNLRKNFIRFTNVYWFHDVTSQIQGQEVFKLQQQALELKREYDFIKDEMERMDEFLQGKYNQMMGAVSLLLAILAIFISLMQFEWIASNVGSGFEHLWQLIKVFFVSQFCIE